jgi:metal-sulfur cluster biosynthetic enzyme
MDKELVIEKLRKVIDPELGVNVVDLGLIYDVEVINENSKQKTQPSLHGISQTADLAVSKSGNFGGQADNRDKDKLSDKQMVKITMTLTSPGCPLAGSFDFLVRAALQEIPDLDVDKDVQIDLTFDPPWTMEMMSEEVQMTLGLK